MNRADLFFEYSDRYRSGAFDLREVVRWHSEGEAYYKKYILHFRDGSTTYLDPDEFDAFKKRWEGLPI